MTLKEEILKVIDVKYIKRKYPNLISSVIIMAFCAWMVIGLFSTSMTIIQHIPGIMEAVTEDMFNESAVITLKDLDVQTKINFIQNVALWLMAALVGFIIFLVLLFISALNEFVRVITGQRTDEEKLDAIIKSLRIRKDEI